MVYHAEMVSRASNRALVVADLPFGSYHASEEQAIASATRFLKETQCQAVKLEGGLRSASMIRALVNADIPVMAPRRFDAAIGPEAGRVQGPA